MARDLAPLLAGATVDGRLVGLGPGHPPPVTGGLPRRPRGPHRAGCLAARQVARHRPRRRLRAGHPGQDDRPALRAAGGHAARPPRAPAADARAGSGGRRRPGGPVPAGCSSATCASSVGSGSTGVAPTATILGAGDEGGLFARHGPEPLDEAFTLRRFRARLRARRGRLKSIIVDQSFLAGVGNIYADEALWRARLHPLRSVATLGPDHERRLYEAIRGVLAEAVERRGLVGRRLHRARG